MMIDKERRLYYVAHACRGSNNNINRHCWLLFIFSLFFIRNEQRKETVGLLYNMIRVLIGAKVTITDKLMVPATVVSNFAIN
jgi:hypothetical protein